MGGGQWVGGGRGGGREFFHLSVASFEKGFVEK